MSARQAKEQSRAPHSSRVAQADAEVPGVRRCGCGGGVRTASGVSPGRSHDRETSRTLWRARDDTITGFAPERRPKQATIHKGRTRWSCPQRVPVAAGPSLVMSRRVSACWSIPNRCCRSPLVKAAPSRGIRHSAGLARSGIHSGKRPVATSISRASSSHSPVRCLVERRSGPPCLPAAAGAAVSHRTAAELWVIAAGGVVTLRYGWWHVRAMPCRTAQQVAGVLRRRGWVAVPRACGPWCAIALFDRRIAHAIAGSELHDHGEPHSPHGEPHSPHGEPRSPRAGGGTIGAYRG